MLSAEFPPMTSDEPSRPIQYSFPYCTPTMRLAPFNRSRRFPGLLLSAAFCSTPMRRSRSEKSIRASTNLVSTCIGKISEACGLLLRTRDAPEEIRTRLGKGGQIGFIQLFNLEPALPKERWNVAGDVASLERPFEKRFRPLLPTSHINIGRKTVLKKDKATARPQDSANPADRVFDAGNSAHRERANNSVDASI